MEVKGVTNASKKRATFLSVVGVQDVPIASEPHRTGKSVCKNIRRTDGSPEDTLQPGTVRDCRKVQVSYQNTETG